MSTTLRSWTVVDNYIWNEDLSTVIAEANTAANASLIAAAPDLLEACEALTDEDKLRSFAAYIHAYPREPVINLLEREFPKLFAAIARAKGES